MKQYLCALYLFAFAHQTLLHADKADSPILKFIIGINEDSVLVNKKITRAGLPIYRAYSFSTIQEAGYYRLAGNVSNQITIASSNVQLDLGGNTVSGGIVINSNLRNITITNGTVTNSSSNSITVNTGCSSIKIVDVKIQGQFAGPGVIMTQAIDSTIRNCDLIQNTTGISLNSCNNIVIQDCSALENRFAGYSLLTSNTCTITGCKAISTGSTNTSILLTSVFGFVSNNGVGNIFDSCIANSTQALTTTDSSSVIAGFALRGTELGSKITHCAAMNTATSQNGLTLPYGILLESTRVSVLTPTGAPLIPPLLAPLPALNFSTQTDWSPDGQYLACLQGVQPILLIYKFDRKNVTFNRVAIPNIALANSPANFERVRWSPDGQFLAIIQTTGTTKLFVYQFNRTNNSLNLFATGNPAPTTDNFIDINWRPDGKYLAVGNMSNGANPALQLYQFDAIAQKLLRVATALTISGSNQWAFSWSPDGDYLVFPVSTGTFTILKFDQANNSLVRVVTQTTPTTNQAMVALFSPNGKYIAIAMQVVQVVYIYAFDRTTNTTSLYAQGAPADFRQEGCAWHPSSNYFWAGLRAFFFNEQARSLTSVLSISGTITSANFSPDGQYLIAEPETNLTAPVNVYPFLTFPQRNTIAYNTVYCNTGNSTNQQSGIGISGSSSVNFIFQNTVYSNPTNPPILSSNYQYVLNVFNPLYQDVPTLMQNIALGTCDPVLLRRDRPQDFEMLVSKLTDIATKVDAITVT